MSAIKADFQVNDNNGSGYTQYYPAVATAKNGNRLVAWLDERDGVVRTYIFPSGNDVYGRVFSNQGIPLTQSFKINSGTHAPIYSLAASSSGDFFAVAWATSDNTVQLRVFTADGVPITDPQESDLLGSEVSLAMSKDRILIVSNGAPIWGQFFDLSGNKSGTKVPLLDFGLNLGWRSPRVSMRGDGSFVLVYVDTIGQGYLNRNAIFAQQFFPDGQKRGRNLRVSTDSLAGQPSITADAQGNFFVTWASDERAIYLQRYDSAGTPLGDNLKLNDDGTTERKFAPKVACDSIGNLSVVWIDQRGGSYFYSYHGDIYAQVVSGSGTKTGPNFKVNAEFLGDELAPFVGSGVATDKQGNSLICWNDAFPISRLSARMYDANGVPLGPEFPFASDDVGADQYYPSVAANERGDMVFVWRDQGLGRFSIYGQMFDSSGAPRAQGFKVNDEFGSQRFVAYDPSVAMDSIGNFVVVWDQVPTGSSVGDVYGQRYNSSGQPIGSNFMINDNTRRDQLGASIAMRKTGDFAIAWLDARDYPEYDIYAQWYTQEGIPRGSNVKLFAGSNTYPSIIAANHELLVACRSRTDSSYGTNVYALKYDWNTLTKTFEAKVNDSSLAYYSYGVPALSCDKNGNFLVAWANYGHFVGGYRLTERGLVWYGRLPYDVYVQRYTNSGSRLGLNQLVSLNHTDYPYADRTSRLSLSMNPIGEGALFWEDYSNGPFNPDIIGVLFDSTGNISSGYYKLTNEQNPSAQTNPNSVLIGNKLYSVWEDRRIPGHGTDVWANIVEFPVTNPSNHPPGKVSAISPPHGDTLMISDPPLPESPYWINFEWTAAIDPDPDKLVYSFHLFGSNLDTTIVTPRTALDFPEQVFKIGMIHKWLITASDGYNVTPSDTFQFSTTKRDRGVVIGVTREGNEISSVFSLAQNYPNPFNPSTTISFDLPSKSFVSLKVFDALGREVAVLISEELPAGRYAQHWRAERLASGVYFYRLQAGWFVDMKKLILLK